MSEAKHTRRVVITGIGIISCIGLDPQQVQDVRRLIHTLGERRTVLLSTHILSEAEQLCDRIVIIDKGKTIAAGTKDELKAMINRGEKITVELYALEEQDVANIRELPFVARADYDGKRLSVQYNNGQHNLLTLLDYLKSRDLPFERVFSEQPTLNDVFLEITGRELRD